MSIQAVHAKVNQIPSWTQTDLNAQIALGNYPPGTTIADITLSGDWNDPHTVVVTGSVGSVIPQSTSTTVNANSDYYTNEGATALVVYTLPSAAAGLQVTFIVQDADGIRINPAAGDNIKIAAIASSNGVQCTQIGGTVTLLAINDTEWISIATNRTWGAL